MEDRVEDRVEVYEAQLAENHYYGLAPTPYDYQVQSKSTTKARLFSLSLLASLQQPAEETSSLAREGKQQAGAATVW